MHQAERPALPLRVGAEGGDASERRAKEAIPDRDAATSQNHRRDSSRERHPEEAQHEKKRADRSQPRLPIFLDQASDQAALNDCPDQADHGKEIAGRFCVELIPMKHKKGKYPCHDGKSGNHRKIGGDHRDIRLHLDMFKEARKERLRLFGELSLFLGMGLGKDAKNENRIDQSQTASDIHRSRVAKLRRSPPPDRWTKDETQAESGTNQTHRTRTLLRRGDIRHVGLRGSDTAAGEAVNNAAHKKHREGLTDSHDDKSNGGSKGAEEQNWPPTESIRYLAQNRGGKKLHEGKYPEEPTDLPCARAETFSVKGKHGNNDPEADHINKDGEKND